jgi:hypothetical protein
MSHAAVVRACVTMALALAACGERLEIGQDRPDAGGAEDTRTDSGGDWQVPCVAGQEACISHETYVCGDHGLLQASGRSCCSPGESLCLGDERWSCSAAGTWEGREGPCNADGSCTFAYSWTSEYLGSTLYRPEAITGTSATDVWVFQLNSADTVLHRGPDGWTTMPLPATDSIWAAWSRAEDDAWAVGAEGAILRWNGSAWSRQWLASNPGLSAVWSSGPDDAWAVGSADGPYAAHWDGLVWTPVTIADATSGSSFLAVSGAAASDVWVLQQFGDAFHWNGTSWERVAGADTGLGLAISGSASGDVWMAGYDSSVWCQYPGPPYCYPDSRVMHWDGAAWSAVAGPFFGAALDAIWGSQDRSVWAHDRGGRLWLRDGDWWCWISAPSWGARGVGPDPDNVWGVNEGEIFRLSL